MVYAALVCTIEYQIIGQAGKYLKLFGGLGALTALLFEGMLCISRTVPGEHLVNHDQDVGDCDTKLWSGEVHYGKDVMSTKGRKFSPEEGLSRNGACAEWIVLYTCPAK